MKSIGLMLVALLAGVALGSAASVFICGESVYATGYWNQFTGAFVLSPFLMSLGLWYAPLLLPWYLSPLLFVGLVICTITPCMGVRERYPLPQWLTFGGAFLWSLGNATVLEAMMGI